MRFNPLAVILELEILLIAPNLLIGCIFDWPILIFLQGYISVVLGAYDSGFNLSIKLIAA